MVTFDLCEGNPGALTFMMAAYDKYLFFAERAFARMRDNGIKGSKLYMLWNDCCDRDISKAVDIMINEAYRQNKKVLPSVIHIYE